MEPFGRLSVVREGTWKADVCTILYDVSGCATLEKYITTYIRNVTSKTQAAACDNCHDLLLFVSCSGF